MGVHEADGPQAGPVAGQPTPVEMPDESPHSAFPPHGGESRGVRNRPRPNDQKPPPTPLRQARDFGSLLRMRCPPIPSRSPRRPEAESIPEEVREFAAFADALMDPDNCDPFVVHNYLKQMELTAKAKAKLADEALAEAAARRHLPRRRSHPSWSVPRCNSRAIAGPVAAAARAAKIRLTGPVENPPKPGVSDTSRSLRAPSTPFSAETGQFVGEMKVRIPSSSEISDRGPRRGPSEPCRRAEPAFGKPIGRNEPDGILGNFRSSR